MSVNLEEPGPSRIKRKNSDPEQGHGESKCKTEETHQLMSSGNEEDTEEEKAAKLGEYLSSQYEVVLRLLNNLPAFDLRRAAQVSKSWQTAANVIRDSRFQFHWLFWRANSGGWNIPPPLALYSSLCEHVYSQPTLCIAFFTRSAIKTFECSAEYLCPVTKQYKCCGKQHPVESYMSLALGPKCTLLSFTVSGVIGTSLDLKSTFEVEHINRGKAQAMSAALFPNSPGVKIVRFKMTKQELFQKRSSTELAKDLGIPSNMLIQALALFTGHRVRENELSMLVAHLQARQEHRFAVAGGIGEKADGIEGLVFLGDDVAAVSLIIPETVTEKDTVVEHVTKIKNCNLPSERSMCLMFTCLGRGTMWYLGENNVESSIINKMFPQSPVIGFFGRGEIGLNFLCNFPAHQDSKLFWQDFKSICNESKKSLEAPPKEVKRGEFYQIDHAYSTCLLYLTFNVTSANLSL
ncbi:F-box only protein 22 [Frankliniella occidentalis]|uniref:F-box only protein 22 n=1 Tax=Frankliniella occidentalis TaxID=133901 RepID=A0A6J1T563_FRAOC|nr:F-box only protein 22 [Frankliniella occidentalis]XP_026288730.1 F-box only protein 22 [Frankliniella occidentalis]XP_026288731.1 F-box only protein 22 [Frankliniella occidentalis]